MQQPPVSHLELVQLAFMIFSVDLLRYVLVAGTTWLLVGVFLRERLRSRRIGAGEPRPGQKRREFGYSLSTVAIFAANGLMLWLFAQNGAVRIYTSVAERGWAWWWASLALIIIAHDAYFYATHRLLHHPRWFARVHAVHHGSVHPTPWAAYSFHPVEAAFQAAFLPLFVLFVPVHDVVIAVFLIHMIVRNAIGHCAHELLPWHWTPRGPLRWVTPVSHHHFHHANNRGNFGLYFTWWDRWCGTEDAAYLRQGDARWRETAAAGAA